MEKANTNLCCVIITIQVLMTKLGFLTTFPLVLHLSFRERREEERDRPGEEERRREGQTGRGELFIVLVLLLFICIF